MFVRWCIFTTLVVSDWRSKSRGPGPEPLAPSPWPKAPGIEPLAPSIWPKTHGPWPTAAPKPEPGARAPVPFPSPRPGTHGKITHNLECVLKSYGKPCVLRLFSTYFPHICGYFPTYFHIFSTYFNIFSHIYFVYVHRGEHIPKITKELQKNYVEIHGSPWNSVGIRGNPWDSVGIRGITWGSMGLLRTRRTISELHYVGIRGITQKSIGFHWNP